MKDGAHGVDYGRGQRSVELASIALFALLAAAGLWRLAMASGAWLPLLLAVPCGWLAADLGSGLLHFAFDSWGSVTTPLIGRAFIRPFREHHAEPEAMTRHDFVETHGASCFAVLPLLAVACFAPFEIVPVFLQSVLLCTSLGAFATNQCHKWAHMEAAATPRLVLLAQRWRLALPREHHGLHHRPPFDSHFCMSSGWMNPAFDFFLSRFR
jgi:ubiquitin-conjugating enzyme E2 variant